MQNTEHGIRNTEHETLQTFQTFQPPMDFRQHLLHPLSLHFIDHMVMEVLTSPTDFETVYQLIFDTDEKVAWRAAWACQKISEKHPEWFTEKQFIEIANLTIFNSHGGLQRGCLSILNNLPFPGTISVEFINSCFDRMVSLKYPVSIQCLSMKILSRICILEPDFKPELQAYLENIDAGAYTAGFRSTRSHILKALKSK